MSRCYPTSSWAIGTCITLESSRDSFKISLILLRLIYKEQLRRYQSVRPQLISLISHLQSLLHSYSFFLVLFDWEKSAFQP